MSSIFCSLDPSEQVDPWLWSSILKMFLVWSNTFVGLVHKPKCAPPTLVFQKSFSRWVKHCNICLTNSCKKVTMATFTPDHSCSEPLTSASIALNCKSICAHAHVCVSVPWGSCHSDSLLLHMSLPTKLQQHVGKWKGTVSHTWENGVSEKGETNPNPEQCDWSSHWFVWLQQIDPLIGGYCTGIWPPWCKTSPQCLFSSFMSWRPDSF